VIASDSFLVYCHRKQDCSYFGWTQFMTQTFQDLADQHYTDLPLFPGTSWVVMAEPVPQGSIHRLRMKQGTVIPAHTHPCNEYVFVVAGTLKTGERICEAGCFWFTPSGTRQGPHAALTDVELITIRMGEMGEFETQA
jgi:quercetin dioxygenase-like cupin family protein